MGIRVLSWSAAVLRLTLCAAVGVGVALAAGSGSAGYGGVGLLMLLLRELRSLERWPALALDRRR